MDERSGLFVEKVKPIGRAKVVAENNAALEVDIWMLEDDPAQRSVHQQLEPAAVAKLQALVFEPPLKGFFEHRVAAIDTNR